MLGMAWAWICLEDTTQEWVVRCEKLTMTLSRLYSEDSLPRVSCSTWRTSSRVNVYVFRRFLPNLLRNVNTNVSVIRFRRFFWGVTFSTWNVNSEFNRRTYDKQSVAKDLPLGRFKGTQGVSGEFLRVSKCTIRIQGCFRWSQRPLRESQVLL